MFGLCETADLGNLEVETASAPFANRTDEGRNVTNYLIVDHWKVGVLSYLNAFLHCRTRLFEVEARKIFHRPGCLDSLVKTPTAVGIPNNYILVAGTIDDGSNPFRVESRIALNFQLKPVYAFSSPRINVVGHFFW